MKQTDDTAGQRGTHGIAAHKSIYYILLAVLITIQLAYTTYVFAYVKQGSHSDEVWSYGLSNSYYHPFHSIAKGVPLQESTTQDLMNHDQWISGDVLKDYVTVQAGERFAYGSVYYNNTYDMHPPLFHMLLHTICSFFPDSFSWWYGFAISAVCLVGTQIFLFLTARKIAGSESTALAVCLLYGGGKGALCTFTFIRQYTLLVMLCMIFTYFSACCFAECKNGGKMKRKHLVLAALAACLAFLTHYYGIVYVGVFTALFCVYLACKRKWKVLLVYGCSMVLALGLFMAVYPAAIRHILVYRGEAETAFSPAVQIRMLLSYLFTYNYGFSIGYFPTAFWNITLPLLAAVIVAAVALLFPFRDEAWFARLIAWLKKTGRSILHYLRDANYVPLFALGGSAVLYEIVAHSVDVWMMGDFVMRYVSLAVPFAALAAVTAAQLLLSKIFKRKGIVQLGVLLLICAALLRVFLTTDYPYQYAQFAGKADVLAETKGKNVLVLDLTPTAFATDMAFFTPYLYEADSVCFSTFYTLPACMEKEDFRSNKVDYVIVDTRLFALNEEEGDKVLRRLAEEQPRIVSGEETQPGVDSEATNGSAVDGAGSLEPAADEEQEQLVRTRYTQLIEEITDGAPYEVLALWNGQKGIYYILKY